MVWSTSVPTIIACTRSVLLDVATLPVRRCGGLYRRAGKSIPRLCGVATRSRRAFFFTCNSERRGLYRLARPFPVCFPFAGNESLELMAADAPGKIAREPAPLFLYE